MSNSFYKPGGPSNLLLSCDVSSGAESPGGPPNPGGRSEVSSPGKPIPGVASIPGGKFAVDGTVPGSIPVCEDIPGMPGIPQAEPLSAAMLESKPGGLVSLRSGSSLDCPVPCVKVAFDRTDCEPPCGIACVIF